MANAIRSILEAITIHGERLDDHNQRLLQLRREVEALETIVYRLNNNLFVDNKDNPSRGYKG